MYTPLNDDRRALQESQERQYELRVRCCDRYESYAKISILLIFIINIIIYILVQFNLFSKHATNNVVLGMVSCLFFISACFTIYMIVKIIYECVTKKKCTWCCCHGCLEQHQLSYEARVNT